MLFLEKKTEGSEKGGNEEVRGGSRDVKDKHSSVTVTDQDKVVDLKPEVQWNLWRCTTRVTPSLAAPLWKRYRLQRNLFLSESCTEQQREVPSDLPL